MARSRPPHASALPSEPAPPAAIPRAELSPRSDISPWRLGGLSVRALAARVWHEVNEDDEVARLAKLEMELAVAETKRMAVSALTALVLAAIGAVIAISGLVVLLAGAVAPLFGARWIPLVIVGGGAGLVGGGAIAWSACTCGRSTGAAHSRRSRRSGDGPKSGCDQG